MVRESQREALRRWRRTHPDENAEKNREASKRYYEKHREEILEKRRLKKQQLASVQEAPKASEAQQEAPKSESDSDSV